MCFSASASLGAGIVLSAIGVVSIKKAENPSQNFFASIPLIFATQQISEGFLWLALSKPAYAPLEMLSTYVFLFFAQIVWPTWVPLSILLIEKNEKRKLALKLLVAVGMLVSSYMTYCLTSYHVQANIIGYHISYTQHYPVGLSKYGGVLYIMATILPSLFSGIKRMWFLGTAILISYIVTQIFYEDYIVSVWCFFASVISITVYAVMQSINKPIEKILVRT